MRSVKRRDLLASFGAYAVLAASRADAACDVTRSRGDNFSTKSYSCDLGGGQKLNTTFLRVSDVLFDSAGRAPLPGDFGNYQNLVEGHTLIETPAFKTFEYLIDYYSFAFEPGGIFLQFDGRVSDQQFEERQFIDGFPGRWRTLGVWDEPDPDDWPLFPLPDELRKAMPGDYDWDESFLRYANSTDFEDMDVKMAEYLGIWGSHPQGGIDLNALGNLPLLRHIGAGSVDGFLPLVFQEYFGFEGCSGRPSGGAHYVPPALFLDLAVCKNEGTSNIAIDDFFGAVNPEQGLREYISTTPQGFTSFGLQPFDLRPGESVVLVQRLLFGVLPFTLRFNSGEFKETVRPRRAEYGPTHLPKGVVVANQPIAFDGRSHNAVIIGSYYGKGSCPYLFSWCELTDEWVLLGKVLADCVGADNEGVECRRFTGLRRRFKLVEREHERSTLKNLSLTLNCKGGEVVHLKHASGDFVLNIGETAELDFDLPDSLAVEDVLSSELRLRGYYEKTTNADLAARAKILGLAG